MLAKAEQAHKLPRQRTIGHERAVIMQAPCMCALQVWLRALLRACLSWAC